MLYSLRNIAKSYNGRTVLNIQELFIEQGKIYGLMGPNGSGKTTLLSILAFLNAPTTGTLFFMDKPVDFSGRKLRTVRRNVVLADQHPIMFSTSVRQNVAFGLKARGVDKSERTRIVEASLDRVGMRAFMDEPATRLSGGETQRVAIARALACSPKVLLLDEPTASVDFFSQIAIEKIIRDLQAGAGISIILSTHNQNQSARLAHEVIYLFEGRPGTFIHENIFRGRAIYQNGCNCCQISPDICFPLPSSAEGEGDIEISINPKAIQCYAATAADAPENVMTGQIRQMGMEQNRVRLVVDVGVLLTILLRKQGYETMKPMIGETIQVYCPDHGVDVLSRKG